jgi:hypothetical protein
VNGWLRTLEARVDRRLNRRFALVCGTAPRGESSQGRQRPRWSSNTWKTRGLTLHYSVGRGRSSVECSASNKVGIAELL